MLDVILERLDSWMQSDEYKEYKKIEPQHKKELKKFLKKFTEEYISTMPKEDYVSGIKKESFCNCIENGLNFYGGLGFATTAYQKFVLYWSKDLNAYSFGDKRTKQRTHFGSEVDEIYENIIKNLLIVIKASKENDLKAIADTPLNPMFKNKISFLYNSDTQIPINSNDHLNAILAAFEIPFDPKEDRVYKRKKLYDFYVSSGINQKISPYMFMRFIYSEGGYRSVVKQGFEAASAKDVSLVDIKIKKTLTPKKGAKKSGKYNPGSEATKLITGKKGEDIVIAFLKKHKKELDVHNITPWCNQDDSKGYDISYFLSDGTEIFVEVKATKANLKNEVCFEMSANEYNFMREHEDTYYIFFVNNVNEGSVIQRILGKDLYGEIPIKYRLHFESDLQM